MQDTTAPTDETNEDKLTRLLNIRIIHVRRLDATHYRLVTALGTVDFTQADNRVNQTKFRNAVADGARRVIPLFTRQTWQDVEHLLSVMCAAAH